MSNSIACTHTVLCNALVCCLVLVLSGCGYHLYKEQTVASNAPVGSVVTLNYNGDTPDTFRRAAVEPIELIGFDVVDVTNQAQLDAAQALYSLDFFWQRQDIADSLSAGNFAVSVIVDAHYSIRTPEVQDENIAVFVPNKLYTVHAERWHLSYVQTQANSPRSAQYRFGAENDLFVDVTNQALLSQLRIKLQHFVDTTRDMKLGRAHNQSVQPSVDIDKQTDANSGESRK